MRIRRHFEPFQDFKITPKVWKWLGIGAGVVLAGYLTAYLVLFPAPFLPGHQPVPRVLGLTVPEAQAEIQKSKLQVTDGGAEPHPTATAGIVIWQDPPPGVIAPEGTKVVLVSSAGPPKIPVPDVAKLDVGLAQSLVSAAGLVVSQVTDGGAEPHPTATAGIVIWQDPPPGVIAPEGPKVSLVSSAGPPKIPVPDVSNLDATLAQSLVAAAGLVVSQVESVQAASPTGLAMLTRPPAGTALAPGAGVSIVISRGAPTIPIPDLLGMASADARTRLETEGLQLGTVTRRRTADASPGTVVGQRPAAGTLAAPGTVVDVVVARSPQ
jgi:beta-lactam-binding protein with PASTA domain